MTSSLWQCFGMGQRPQLKDVYVKSEDRDSGLGSFTTSFDEVSSLHSMASSSKDDTTSEEHRSHSFDVLPGSSSSPITTHENPLFVQVPTRVHRRLRILMAGSHEVGKSCLVLRFLHNSFITRYNRTTHSVKRVLRKYDSEYYHLQVIDLGGDIVNEETADDLLNEADGIIYVYSADNKKTLDEVAHTSSLLNDSSDRVPSILLANKSDLKREVSSSSGHATARQMKSAFAEVSAKTGEGVHEIFSEFISRLMHLQPPAPIRDCSIRRTI